MKRLTLKRTWKLCLEMWEWIAEQKRAGNKDRVSDLKGQWFEQNSNIELMWGDCFFCEYAKRNAQKNLFNCSMCPGKLVIKNFDCNDVRYYYYLKPIKFYEKLVWINKRRGKNVKPK